MVRHLSQTEYRATIERAFGDGRVFTRDELQSELRKDYGKRAEYRNARTGTANAMNSVLYILVKKEFLSHERNSINYQKVMRSVPVAPPPAPSAPSVLLAPTEPQKRAVKKWLDATISEQIKSLEKELGLASQEIERLQARKAVLVNSIVELNRLKKISEEVE